MQDNGVPLGDAPEHFFDPARGRVELVRLRIGAKVGEQHEVVRRLRDFRQALLPEGVEVRHRQIALEHGPLMIAGALLLLAGLLMFSTGLIGEMMMRTYFQSQDRRIYAVREILTREQNDGQ